MRRLISILLKMAINALQQSFQDSTLTLGKGEVTSSILVTGFTKSIGVRVFQRFAGMPFCFLYSRF
jgi:hypothetical protein